MSEYDREYDLTVPSWVPKPSTKHIISLVWKVKEGTEIFIGKELAIIVIDGMDHKAVTSDIDGVVLEILANDITEKTTRLALLKGCNHAERFHDICTQCERDLSLSLTSKKNHASLDRGDVSLVHGALGFKITRDQALSLEHEYQKKLLQQKKKLSLVLDLDHTLLHATTDLRFVNSYLKKCGDVPSHGDLHKFILDGKPHIVKLRPGLQRFLKDMSEKFELHVFTHGVRAYAVQIGKILDPKGEYFADRVVAREESGVESKTLKENFPCSVRTVLIIDDRSDVWPGFEGNLIQIVPYHYYKLFGIDKEVNNRAGATMASTHIQGFEPMDNFDTVIENDTNLDVVQDMLDTIHKEFFERYFGNKEMKLGDTVDDEVDVIELLSERKKTVLAGTCILFSGIIPLNQVKQQSEVWLRAEAFGAKCVEEFDARTVTHVVTSPDRRNTEKVKQAEKTPGVYIVTKQWLDDSTTHYTRMNEYNYWLLYNKPTQLPVTTFYNKASNVRQFQEQARELSDSIRSWHKELMELDDKIEKAKQEPQESSDDESMDEDSDEEDMLADMLEQDLM
jgi:FCP1-like phosphatase family protein